MSPLIIALDFDDKAKAFELVDQLDPSQCRLKVGKESFTRFGPQFVECLQAKGFEIFLDLKFHDIPNTVAKACKAAADLGVWMLNVHALGGKQMMTAAADAIANVPNKPILIGVTILTSHEQSELTDVGLQGSIEDNVLRLAKLTQDAGLDGIVCSAQEAASLRQTMGSEFQLVTPGIRLSDAGDDQKRIMSPQNAMSAGANYLVVGRPITQSADPKKALQLFSRSLL